MVGSAVCVAAAAALPAAASRSVSSRRVITKAASPPALGRAPCASAAHLRGSNTSAAWGARVLPLVGRPQAGGSRTRARVVSVRAVFEKFTERAIKAVMLAQQEAKNLGALEVSPLLSLPVAIFSVVSCQTMLSILTAHFLLASKLPGITDHSRHAVILPGFGVIHPAGM